MIDFLKVILIGVPILGVIVFVHELGHFIAARVVGVKVTVFSLGFGRRLTGFVRGDTDYRISLLPLGGYVKMAGDNIEEERDGGADEFLSRAWYERAFIAVAGPAANFIMAIVCGILYYATGAEYPLLANIVGPIEAGSVAEEVGLRYGDHVERVGDVATPFWNDVERELTAAAGVGESIALEVRTDDVTRQVRVPPTSVDGVLESVEPAVPPRVGQVSYGTPAFTAGLRAGDELVEIEGAPIRSWQDLSDAISVRPGQETSIVIEREGRRFERLVTPLDNEGVGMIGIVVASVGMGVQQFPLGESLGLGVKYAVDMTGFVVKGLASIPRQFINSPKSLGSNLAGPVAIIQMSAQQAERGRSALLNLLILISIALMVMNLLPIPVLDGGHILVAVIEGVRRRPLAPKVMIAIWRAGMVFLLLLMTFAIANDGLKLVQRKQADREAGNSEPVPAEVRTDDEAGD